MELLNKRRSGDVLMGSSYRREAPVYTVERSRLYRVSRGSETSKYPEEKKSIEIPSVAASEGGEV